jgi:Tfp pilus assembly protein PilF
MKNNIYRFVVQSKIRNKIGLTNNQCIMKKLNYFILFVFAASILSSCGGIKKMQEMAGDVSYTVTPPVLEERGDKVDMKVDVKYPAKYFNKSAILTATPILKYEGGETAFESKTVQGEKVEANNPVITYTTGGSYSYSSSVPFTEDMMKSELVVRVSAELKGKTYPFDDYKIGEGVIATSKLVMVNPKPVMIGDKFQRIIPESVLADIHYIINRAEVRPTELKAEDILAFQAFVKAANENPRVDLKGIEISAYASPDGAVELNEKLSKNREGSADKFLAGQLKKDKIEKAAAEGFVKKTYTAEDWDGFKKLMEESSIQDKELILRVLSMYSDPVVREKEIKNIAAAFEQIAKDVLPQLRRSKLIANVENIGYSDDELKALWASDPNALKLEEVLYTATLFEDLDTKLAIYQKAAANFPNCLRAHNNVGYVYILKGDADNAKVALDKAASLKSNDVTNNNLACVALLKGDVENAEKMFTASMGAGAAVNYNLGIIKIMQGDYDKAATYLGNTEEFNTALIKYLKKDSDGSYALANKLTCENGKVEYLKAIINASKGQDDMMLENLRLAVAKSADLKARAAVDMEFAKYFENEAFKTIVK